MSNDSMWSHERIAKARAVAEYIIEALDSEAVYNVALELMIGRYLVAPPFVLELLHNKVTKESEEEGSDDVH